MKIIGTVEKINKLTELQKQLENLNKEFEAYKKSIRTAPKVGEKIEIADIEWIILDKTELGYLALANKAVKKCRFGKNNNWKDSEIRTYLEKEFVPKIEKEIGMELPSFHRDLWSLDGQTEYGTCEDKVSLISFDEHRKYRKIIPNFGEYWWTITPDTTKGNGNENYTAVVCPSGIIIGSSYYDSEFGVRPFCIFPAKIFESEEK